MAIKLILNDVLYDMYREFCRLKGYKLPTTPLEQLIDDSTGAQKAHMTEFAEWLREEVLSRFEPNEE